MNATVESTYRRYFPLIREKCRRALGDESEAQDVAQETFARLWRDRDKVSDDPRGVTAWIYRTATRLMVDRWRAARVQALEQPELLDPRNPETLLSARQSLRALAKRVPEGELEVGILRRIDGLSQQEIVEVTGHSERTIRRMLARMDARLAELTLELGSP